MSEENLTGEQGPLTDVATGAHLDDSTVMTEDEKATEAVELMNAQDESDASNKEAEVKAAAERLAAEQAAERALLVSTNESLIAEKEDNARLRAELQAVNASKSFNPDMAAGFDLENKYVKDAMKISKLHGKHVRQILESKLGFLKNREAGYKKNFKDSILDGSDVTMDEYRPHYGKQITDLEKLLG